MAIYDERSQSLAATGAERECNATSTTAAMARTLRRDNRVHIIPPTMSRRQSSSATNHVPEDST